MIRLQVQYPVLLSFWVRGKFTRNAMQRIDNIYSPPCIVQLRFISLKLAQIDFRYSESTFRETNRIIRSNRHYFQPTLHSPAVVLPVSYLLSFYLFGMVEDIHRSAYYLCKFQACETRILSLKTMNDSSP